MVVVIVRALEPSASIAASFSHARFLCRCENLNNDLVAAHSNSIRLLAANCPRRLVQLIRLVPATVTCSDQLYGLQRGRRCTE
jgi:hypothetical protein